VPRTTHSLPPQGSSASTRAAFAPLAYPALDAGRTAGAAAAPSRPGSDLPASADLLRERAEARGHAAGYAAGLRLAERELEARRDELEALHVDRLVRLEAQVAARVAALGAATRALDARVSPVAAEAEGTLAVLAVELAEAVLGHALRTEPASAAEAALRRALDVVDPALVVSVRLHPDDVAVLAGSTDDSCPVLVADPSLARGDAEADLPVGHVDARLTTAAARMRAALLEGDA